MIYVIAYLTVVTEGLIAIYALHRCHRGLDGNWRDLGRQLLWRAPSTPIAIVVRRSR